MKILFVIGSLSAGGAERIFVDIINNIDLRKNKVKILLIDKCGVYFEKIPKEIELDYVFNHCEKPFYLRKWYGLLSVIGKFFFRKISASFFYKNKIKEKYDIEIAFLEGDATKFVSASLQGSSVKYAWIHTDMIRNAWSQKCYKNEKEEQKAYQRFERVLAVSSSVKESYEQKFGGKAEVFYNPLDEKYICDRASEFPEGEKWDKDILEFVSVGRLNPVKGYERLVQIFARLIKKYPNIRLKIVGEGTEREKLERLIAETGNREKICLCGYQKNPYPYIKQGDVFICSSYAEGFSTVVTEALILGTPVITTDCAGMHELLGDSEWGMIVENNDLALYQGLERMITDRCLRERYEKKAIERGEMFSIKKQIQLLESIMENDIKYKVS